MGQRCPYPAFYQAIGAELPVDSSGVCIFHSGDAAWKRALDFPGQFFRLVAFLNADERLSVYDFAEFVFVGGPGGEALRLEGLTFRQTSHFTSASFLDAVSVDHVELARGATFARASFASDLKVQDTKIHGLDVSDAAFGRLVWFSRVEFLDFALFMACRFTGTTTGTVVKIEESRFEGITDFSDAVFTLGPESSVGFWQVRFEHFTNFQKTRFQCHLEFDRVVFGDKTEFVDTSFESVGSSARYRGAAVELNRIEVPAGAMLTFKSTDPRNKMFHHDVQVSFAEDPAGTIRFDNVDFSKLSSETRLRLMRLSKLGTVEIGAGCIKYRFQTAVRTVAVRESNSPLVVELCQTFTNYFTQSNGLNLGFEIVDRDANKVSFFYFTDEDISEEIFLQRLADTERQLWSLLSGQGGHPLLPGPGSDEQSAGNESTIINTVDGISALLGTFFRVGARIALGMWKATDTRALLTAIGFNEQGAEDRASSLHRVIVAKYTGKALLSINSRQNELLLPMVNDEEQRLVSGKVSVLYLAANSLVSRLDLEREFSLLQKLNVALTPVWAVTIETLTQALLTTTPAIVHFSGHGSSTGIVLRDERGGEREVSTDALASLFKLFRRTVNCVVLNSCYSEAQALAIRQHVPHVIGMRDDMPDTAAIAFSCGFYQAIGAGRNVPFAFKFGLTKIELEGGWGYDIPVLL
jgi:hypothetical protein